MKILHVITSLQTGGAEKLMVDLLPKLKSKGYDADLLLFDGKNTPFRQEIESSGIKVFDLGTGGSVYSIKKLFKLAPFLKEYDIVHTHNTSPQFFSAIISLFYHSYILVTTEHGGSNRRRSIKGLKIIDRWMYHRYQKIICIADKTKENLLTYLGGKWTNIVTVNNGVDVTKYATASTSADFDIIAPNTRKIIMVAGFRWEKDQDTLIKAIQFLPEEFHLFLIGDGVRRQELEALIKELHLENRIHLMGIRSDVANLLHAADYVVMSSHFEGLSLSSVEGMSVGKPFIASDVDGLREVVKDAGLLFPHQDANALANEIIRLDNDKDLYNAVALACKERAKEYDISKMVDGYINIYNSL